MTTIAYRNGILAADTRTMMAGSVIGTTIKIARRSDGDLAGASGNAVYAAAFLEWFIKGEKTEPPKAELSDDNIDRGAIFTKSCDIWVYEPGGKFLTRAEYFAFGSGIEYALGAMHAGASAELAVQAATAHDRSTGGAITVLSH